MHTLMSPSLPPYASCPTTVFIYSCRVACDTPKFFHVNPHTSFPASPIHILSLSVYTQQLSMAQLPTQIITLPSPVLVRCPLTSSRVGLTHVRSIGLRYQSHRPSTRLSLPPYEQHVSKARYPDWCGCFLGFRDHLGGESRSDGDTESRRILAAQARADTEF